MSSFHQSLAAFWAEQTEKSQGKKKKKPNHPEPVLGPFAFRFLSIARLILGHRCSFWMSDPGDRCFPLNLLSLPQSVYSVFPFQPAP
jgi:hypothetical protein